MKRKRHEPLACREGVPTPTAAEIAADVAEKPERHGQSTPYASWLTRLEVANRLGISHSKVRRMEKRGELHPVETPEGWKFDPLEVEELAETKIEVGGPELLAAAAGLVRQAQDHAARSFDMGRETARELLTLMADVLKSQQAQIADLQKNNFAMRQAAEDALSQEAERQTRVLEMQNSAELKQRALDSLRPLIPAIAAYLGVQTHGDPTPQAAMAICAWLESDSDDQLRVIVESRVLTDTQVAGLLGLRDALQKARANPQEQPKAT
jgi:hypothetical protein